MKTRVRRALALAWLAGIACAACMHAGNPGDLPGVSRPPEPDSVTLGLWHMDEIGGTRVADSGPLHLDGTAGRDTRTEYGRFRSARVFNSSIESFVFVPYVPAFDASVALTIEAWIYPASFTGHEDTPIATRWTEQANEKSWLFSLVGRVPTPRTELIPSPGYHESLVRLGSTGRLMFVLQPGDAGHPVAYFSQVGVELERWTHVAATYDGQVVRFYLDGRLDSQYALEGRIRPSTAPVIIGNYIDPHQLTAFSGGLRSSAAADTNSYYAFRGMIDEVRLSAVARTDFRGGPAR